MLNLISPFKKRIHHADNFQYGHTFEIEKQQKLQQLLESREKIRINKSKPITFSSPILKQNGKPVFFPRTINVIQGKAGVHKSRLAENICSAMLKQHNCQRELLSFKANDFETYTICYVDTERNLSDQLPYSLQQIQLKAGYQVEENPENFDYISLLEFKREERFEILNTYLEYVRTKFENHILIVLDVITDCVFNFNDTKDSLKLIDMMNDSINKYNVSFLCLIHENPGSTDKARGHLGTEIMNKASTVIQVGFEKDAENKPLDIIKVAYLKCRSSKKHEPFYIQYCEEEKGLVLANDQFVADCLDTKNHKANLSELLELLPVYLYEPLEKKELIKQLMDEFDCNFRTIERRLKELIDAGTHIPGPNDDNFTLEKQFQNRKVTYFLKNAENL